jgi:hypothetical protein
MDLRTAIKEQYHAGLAMLRQCVELCPEDMWAAGKHPRTYYRIVFHSAFFTQLGMGQDLAAFQPWPGRRQGWHPRMWEHPEYVEPYELPEGAEVYSREEMVQYIDYVDGLVDPLVDRLDLDTDYSGYSWQTDISKLSQQLMNLRHLQGHVGQLSELLMLRDPSVEVEWVARA